MSAASNGHRVLDLSAHPTIGLTHTRPVHQAPPLRSFAESRRSCIAASLGTMFRYRRRLHAAWPGHWSFPLMTRRRSWGSVAPFAGLLPHTGGGSFLIGPDPLACLSSRRAPIDFRRVDSPLLRCKKHESRHCAAEPRAPGLASGLRLPSAVRIPKLPVTTLRLVEPAGPFLPWAYPLSGMRAHGVHSVGLDPARIIRSRRRFDPPSHHSWAYIRVPAAAFFARQHANFPSAFSA